MLCDRYLERLPLSPELRCELSARASDDGNAAPSEAMRNLHAALAFGAEPARNPAQASIAGRLRHAYGGPATPIPGDGAGAPLRIAPPLNRASMTSHPWGPLNPLVRWLQSFRRNDAGKIADATGPINDSDADAPDPQGNWQHNGNVRRLILLTLMLVQTSFATYFMSMVLPYHGTKRLEMVLLALFAVLCCWVSAGFWTAMAGFLVLTRGRDRYMISRNSTGTEPIDAQARTAIVMPICNEDVARVFAGLRATYESLARHTAVSGELERFDFFVLSDSGKADICAAETNAWIELCRAVGGFGRIFYRHRRRRVKRKSGNIDDFCRRWGKNYKYMIVLDADSVMSGECLSTLVRLMEANPGAGIIQTAPRAAGRDTLYARIQQFSTRVYGPLFTAGLHYWQLGESHYWGHNAIIRLTPFIRHCALAPLPGKGSLAGEILSHDFVEAALMRRAGWAVWIAYDLDGSFEEMPPNLLDELKRDRRWCHGNLMNFRLFLARGMHPVHRAVFATGVMAYLSAPLWFMFLALSTVLLAAHTLTEPQYFVAPRQLFPIWPEWHPEKALALFSATAMLLFVPKLLSVLVICMQGARQFGGKLRLIMSMAIELVFSMLLAPVRMLFHSAFVSAAFLGLNISWKSPPREDTETTWGEALRRHGFHTLLGFAWGGAVFWLNPSFLWWLLPIVGSLALSVPISVLSSRVSFGRRFRSHRLFVIPEENEPPVELRATAEHLTATETPPSFLDAVVDPKLNALACACGHAHPDKPQGSRERLEQLVQFALRSGPDQLTEPQKHTLLGDPELLSQLHFEVWSSADTHPQWLAATVPESAFNS